MSEKKKLSLTSRIVIGMVAGIILGTIIRYVAGDNAWVSLYLTNGLFDVVGQIFITSLKMLVVPLVFVSLVVGTCSLSDPSKLGRLGGKAVGMYMITTAIAISFAIFSAVVVQPGSGIERSSEASFEANEAPSISEVIINLFPDNPINAMAEGNMLQIIVWCVCANGEAIHRNWRRNDRQSGQILPVSTLCADCSWPYCIPTVYACTGSCQTGYIP